MGLLWQNWGRYPDYYSSFLSKRTAIPVLNLSNLLKMLPFFPGKAIHRDRLKPLFCLVLVLVLMANVGCNAAKADKDIDPQLEQQILEVIRKHPEVLIESVQNYQKQQQQQQEQEKQSFFKDLQSDPKKVIGDSPVMGVKDNYKVVLVEFSDFQCPFCARAHGEVKKFMEKHGNEVTLTYKHLPLVQIHEQALPAAQASWAAQQQGKFWEFHDAMFENQNRLGEDFYGETAQKLGLDMKRFNQDRQKAQAAVQKDLELAQQLKLTGTPTFVMVALGKNTQPAFAPGVLSVAELEGMLASVKGN